MEGLVPHWIYRLRRAFGDHLALIPIRSRRVARLSSNVRVRYPNATTATYYVDAHQNNDAYKLNNWLISEIDALLSIKPESVLEVGCGNGRFLAAVKDRVKQVKGVDWAESPILKELGVLAHFALCDITSDELPKADLVCSADVLEHIAPNLLRPTLERLHRAGLEQYHVIACYDDEHSHLSIMEPRAWLFAFQEISKRYQLVDIRLRRGNAAQSVCVIASFDPRFSSAS
jgi:SAM-dependent methyltransferase